MTVAFANPVDQAEWIKNHTVSKRMYIHCYGTRYPYCVVDDTDEDMLIWIGYCANSKTFYVSNVKSKRLREQIVAMECARIFHNEHKSHLSAVKLTFQDIRVKGKFRATLIKTLQRFYEEYADKFADLHELSKEQQDIIATALYLTNLQG